MVPTEVPPTVLSRSPPRTPSRIPPRVQDSSVFSPEIYHRIPTGDFSGFSQGASSEIRPEVCSGFLQKFR